MRWPYTPERVRLESLKWDEIKTRVECRHLILYGRGQVCKFQGVRYRSIRAAERATGHTRHWLEKYGLVIYD